MRRDRFRLLLLSTLLACAACASGCGYRWMTSGGGSAESRVAVLTLDNGSKLPGVELMVSDALRREFLRRGVLRVVSDPARADLVVNGRVRPFRIRAESVSSVVGALEYSVTLNLDLDVREGDAEPFRVPALRATAVYPASADVEVERRNRDEALRRLADVLASRAHEAIELQVLR